MIALVLPSPGTYGSVLQTYPSEAYTGQTSGVIGFNEHGHVHQLLWVVALGTGLLIPVHVIMDSACSSHRGCYGKVRPFLCCC